MYVVNARHPLYNLYAKLLIDGGVISGFSASDTQPVQDGAATKKNLITHTFVS